MMTARANQVFRIGMFGSVALGLLIGRRAIAGAMVVTVGILVVLLVTEGIRVCIAELGSRDVGGCIVTGTSYVAGVIVLLAAMFALINESPDANLRSTAFVGLSLVLLLIVVFAGLLREGTVSIKSNIRRRRYVITSVNIVVLLGASAVLLYGGSLGQLSTRTFRTNLYAIAAPLETKGILSWRARHKWRTGERD